MKCFRSYDLEQLPLTFKPPRTKYQNAHRKMTHSNAAAFPPADAKWSYKALLERPSRTSPYIWTRDVTHWVQWLALVTRFYVMAFCRFPSFPQRLQENSEASADNKLRLHIKPPWDSSAMGFQFYAMHYILNNLSVDDFSRIQQYYKRKIINNAKAINIST